MSAFYIIFMLIGIPWNVLLIVVILKKRLFKQPAILLLLNLATTNLLFCIIIMPMIIAPTMAHEYIFGKSDYVRCQVCYAEAVIMAILLLMSAYSVVLLSVDRFLYLKKPLKYSSIVTAKRVAGILVLCWVLFTAFSILPVFGVGFVAFAHVIAICTIVFQPFGGKNYFLTYYWFYIVLASMIPIVILLFTNTWMLCIVRKSYAEGYLRAKRNSNSTSTHATQMKRKHIKGNIRLTQIFGALFLSSIFTWMPLALTAMMYVAGGVFIEEFSSFAVLCFFSQSVIHPIIQILLLQDVRVVIIKPFKKLLSQCRSQKHNSMSPNVASNEGEESGKMPDKKSCCVCCSILDRCGWALVDYSNDKATSKEANI